MKKIISIFLLIAVIFSTSLSKAIMPASDLNVMYEIPNIDFDSYESKSTGSYESKSTGSYESKGAASIIEAMESNDNASVAIVTTDENRSRMMGRSLINISIVVMYFIAIVSSMIAIIIIIKKLINRGK